LKPPPKDTRRKAARSHEPGRHQDARIAAMQVMVSWWLMGGGAAGCAGCRQGCR
jgi:hypothetical protein